MSVWRISGDNCYPDRNKWLKATLVVDVLFYLFAETCSISSPIATRSIHICVHAN